MSNLTLCIFSDKCPRLSFTEKQTQPYLLDSDQAQRLKKSFLCKHYYKLIKLPSFFGSFGQRLLSPKH